MLHKCYSVGWLPQIYVDSGEMSGLWSEEDLWVEIRLQQWGEIISVRVFSGVILRRHLLKRQLFTLAKTELLCPKNAAMDFT